MQIANPNTATDNISTEIIKQALSRYSTFITEDTIDYFKVDNFLNEERVKGYYKHNDEIVTAYKSNPRAFNLTAVNHVFIPRKQDKLKIREGKRYSMENNKLVAETLHTLEGLEESEEYIEAVRYFEQKAPYMLQAYKKLGYQKLAELGYKKAAIQRAVLKADFESKINLYPVFDAVHNSFVRINAFYSATGQILKALKEIYLDFEISRTAKASDIAYFFECKPTCKKVDGKSVKGYVLFRAKQLPHLDYQRT